MFNLKINNFRSFLDQSFKFSRINILIGENNGGKSSLLKFLLTLKQSFESPDELNLKLTGDYVDLGNYQETIYYRNIRKPLSFSFEFDEKYAEFFVNFMIRSIEFDDDEDEKYEKRILNNERNKVVKHLKKYFDSTSKLTFNLSSKLNSPTAIKTRIENNLIGQIEIEQIKQPDTFLTAYRTCNIKFQIGDIIDTFKDVTITKDSFLSLVHGEIRDLCIKRYKSKGEALFYKLAFLLVTQNYLRNTVDRIKYVNPIKTVPKRFYFQEDKKNSYRLIDIEKFVNILGDKSISERDRNIRMRFMNILVKNLGIADEIRLIQDNSLPVLALEVKTNGLWSNITDVGYGVSLQIPILFQAMLSEVFSDNGETLLIEQPEVHLHPSLQAKFIDSLLLLGKKNTYFIETHSEHIIRKLQSLVKNNTHQLSPLDISIHYFKRGEKKFTITSHSITEKGILTPQFPTGFYDVSYNLVKELL